MRYLVGTIVILFWIFFTIFNWDYVFNQKQVMEMNRLGIVVDRPQQTQGEQMQLLVRWEDNKQLEAVTVNATEYLKSPPKTYFVGKQITNDPTKWVKALWGNIAYYFGWLLLITIVVYGSIILYIKSLLG